MDQVMPTNMGENHMATSLRFDHIIILVNDLDAATQDFTDLGFTIVYGGEHAGGTTHNALIAFADGSYMELLGPTNKPHSGAENTDFSYLFKLGEGWYGYAFLADDLPSAVEAVRARGLKVSDISEGQRHRPDGELLRWRGAMIEGMLSPFILDDVTPRELRVPIDKAQHANGVTGVGGVTLLVDDLYTAAERYEGLLGSAPKIDETRARFVVDGTVIRLARPTDDETRRYVAERPGAPYLLTLRTADASTVGELDLAKTHKARIAIVE